VDSTSTSIPADPSPSVAANEPSAPIADLTYRNYDGPLHSRAVRWWTIAFAMFKLHTKPLTFKIVAALAVIPYLFIIVILWFQDQFFSANNGKQITSVLSAYMDNTVGQKYAIQFYNALGYQLLYLVILTLIAGAGSIASDNRSNALLIYLSKSITKTDYLLGKWFGLFLTLFMVAFGPALLLYFFCLVSYTGDGFLHDEPRLFLHVVESTAITSAVFTSVMIGLSAWSKSPRVIGAVLAGIYFAGQIVSVAVWAALSRGNLNKNVVVLHSSIGGMLSGLTQGIYGITFHLIRFRHHSREVIPTDVAPPPGSIMWSIAFALIVGGIFAARAKVRAVEVIS